MFDVEHLKMKENKKMKKKNILVILCDQLRRNALSCYGDKNVKTPNIDALAENGVQFSKASSTYPVCVPFRFTMMTGEYAHSRYVPSIEWRMSPSERTLADEFNEAGYDTLYCGKWHLYGGHGHLPHHSCKKASLTPIPPVYQGRWKKWLGFDVANNPFNTYYFEDADPVPKKVEGYQTDGLFDLTMNELKSRKSEKPFMSILSVEPPHFPLEVPDEYLDKWKDKELELPPNFLYEDDAPSPSGVLPVCDKEKLLENLRIYYAMIENLDWNVGRMMSFLEKKGLKENTIIMFVSDHGQLDGAHSIHSLLKSHPYEESIGIPLIVSNLNENVKGITIDEAVSTEDLFPTLLGLVGLTPKNELPGIDLCPLMNKEIDTLPREGVLLECVHDLRPGFSYHEKYWRGFRTHRYKYTVLGDGKAGGKPWQFYDLEKDPYEMNNLVNDEKYRELVVHHHKLLREKLVETRDHYVFAEAWGCEGLNLWDHIS